MTGALCLPLPRWLAGAPSGIATCDPRTGICDAYAVDEDGRRVPLAPGAVAVGRAVAVAVRDGRLSPPVRAYAVAALRYAGVRPTDAPGAAQALLAAVAEDVRYTPDPHLAEEVQAPAMLLVTRAGDCDDMAALVGALCEAVGLPARVVLVRYTRPDLPAVPVGSALYDHVFVEIDVAPPGASDWRAADATLPGAADINAVLGLDPSTLAAVEARLTLDPYAPGDAAPLARRVAGGPSHAPMRTLARPLGTPLFGNDFPGFGGGSSLGLGLGNGLPGFGGGFEGFSLDPFGTGSGLNFGPTSEFGALFAGDQKRGGSPSSQWVERFIAILTVATPFLIVLFGRGRGNASADGVIFSPTSPQPPPGYRRVTNPATGETADVPIATLEDQAYEAWEQGPQGGIGLGTVALVAAAGFGAYYIATRTGSASRH